MTQGPRAFSCSTAPLPAAVAWKGTGREEGRKGDLGKSPLERVRQCPEQGLWPAGALHGSADPVGQQLGLALRREHQQAATLTRGVTATVRVVTATLTQRVTATVGW